MALLVKISLKTMEKWRKTAENAPKTAKNAPKNDEKVGEINDKSVKNHRKIRIKC